MTTMGAIKGLFREFLETSTIHGIQHIGGEKSKLAKLVWVVIVVCGFSIAAVLILDSVKGWEESPVSTSVETLPISEVHTTWKLYGEVLEIKLTFIGCLPRSDHLSSRGFKYCSELWHLKNAVTLFARFETGDAFQGKRNLWRGETGCFGCNVGHTAGKHIIFYLFIFDFTTRWSRPTRDGKLRRLRRCTKAACHSPTWPSRATTGEAMWQTASCPSAPTSTTAAVERTKGLSVVGGKDRREKEGNVSPRPMDGSTGALSAKLPQANMICNLFPFIHQDPISLKEKLI